VMSSIRQSMADQGRRQDEIASHLSALPRILEMIPENNRLQGETLKAIHDQLVHQAEQQETLNEILEKLSDSGGEQNDLLDGLRERMENLNQQDKAMADSLFAVKSAMESVGRSSTASAHVLEQLRDNLNARDGDLERTLHTHGVRFTVMSAVAVCLSALALAAVIVIGVILIHAK
jgi:chromosome segregation ATPase